MPFIVVIMGFLGISILWAQQPVHRFLLVAGANNGGKERPVLRYAVTDAQAFAGVLSEMGGIPADQQVLLREPNVRDFRQGFSELEKKLSQPKHLRGRKEVVVYYSGHADENGLRLGKDLMPWPELRKSVDALGADVKIAVIDACGSGAITRLKGGVARPAFLSDASSDMKGYAFLTSSSENEVSQESDRIRGSFFTHALVSGLRGAADMSGDGKVTLSESYQFAFNETLQKTQASSGGAQHPSRDMNLAGTGDVVMTDLRQTSAALVLHQDLEGRVFIRDRKEQLVAELYKSHGRALEMGLPPGTYQIQLEQNQLGRADQVVLQEGKKVQLKRGDFRTIKKEKAIARGSSINEAPYQTSANLFYNPSLEPARGIQMSFVVNDAKTMFQGTQIAFVTNLARQEMSGVQITTGVNIAFGATQASQVSSGANLAKNIQGVQLSSGFNLADTLDGFQIAAGVNVTVAPYQGFQAASVNIAKSGGDGPQLGVVNVNGGSVTSFQAGVVNIVKQDSPNQFGVVNVSGQVQHRQLGITNVAMHAGHAQSGVVNFAKKVDGSQLGIFNSAGSVGGRQIGLVNVSKHSDKTPIGLINLVGNGIFDVTSYVDETHSMGWTLHMGTPMLYTLFDFSAPIGLSKQWPQSLGIGLGTRFGMQKHYWNLDYTFSNVYDHSPQHYQLGVSNGEDQENFHHKVRLGIGYTLFTGLALTAGVSANVLSLGYGRDFAVSPGGDYYWHWQFSQQYQAHIWPGLYAGITLGKF